MKQCPKCAKSYLAKTNFCTVDGEELIDTKEPKALEAETLPLHKENSHGDDDTMTYTRWDLVGSYMQERDEENTNAPGDTSKHIRCYAVNTTATVLVNSMTGKYLVIETTFWKYYYVFDLNHLEERYFIATSRAEFVHREYARRGGKISMTGNPAEGTVRLQIEPLLGEKEQISEIHRAVRKETDFVRNRYKESQTEWSLDKCGNLIKEKSYGPGGPVKIEKFIRRF